MTSTTTAEDFGSTPEDFDLDSWIDQATRPRREVTIYRDWALLEEYDRLAAQLAAGAAIDDESMGEAGDEGIRAQMQEVLDRMEASALTFTLQALTGAELKALAETAPTRPMLDADGEPVMVAGKPGRRVDEIALGDARLAASIISPEVTAAQIARMRDALGDGPMHALYVAAAELTQAGQVLPAIPSSRER